jgi:hypothetical protein
VTATTTEAPNTEIDARPASPPPILWHNAANFEELLRALEGMSYTAMCGHVCQGQRGVCRHRDSLSPIERCAVCADLCAVKIRDRDRNG